ncbi:hypothetical protein DFJ58DRAFT_733155 [Suillus subalutaceus]|uniref:uncharacterized protein n=1 Tax=Suillus subalutaceus TaxID=48586 RepID=UPI001B882DA7|nr:uncharacterized protein DFJ58DRAFT_733155 [Suillus subalutaceus]KAG1839814.1 hypothetical protein DFJ58DRAFT_733155 [Suillus subalutaceus]
MPAPLSSKFSHMGIRSGTLTHLAHLFVWHISPPIPYYPSFSARRVLWRPVSTSQIALVSNEDFGGGSGNKGILKLTVQNPDAIEILDARCGRIAKWTVEVSMTGDSHALWVHHICMSCHIPYSGPTSDDVPTPSGCLPDAFRMPSGCLPDAHPDLHTLIHAFSPPVRYRFGSIHLRTSIYPYLWTSAAKPASSTLNPIGSELIQSRTLPSLDYRSISMIHILVSSSPRSPDPLIRYPDASSNISRPPDPTYTHIRSPNLKSASISLW